MYSRRHIAVTKTQSEQKEVNVNNYYNKLLMWNSQLIMCPNTSALNMSFVQITITSQTSRKSRFVSSQPTVTSTLKVIHVDVDYEIQIDDNNS